MIDSEFRGHNERVSKVGDEVRGKEVEHGRHEGLRMRGDLGVLASCGISLKQG